MKTFAVSFLCSPSKIRKKTGESPVEVSISVNGERVYSQLPITCNPELFKKSLSSQKMNSVRKYTETVRQRINEIQTELAVRRIPVTARLIKLYLEGKDEKSYTLLELCNEYLKTKMDNPVAYGKYKNTFKRLRDFLGDAKPISDVTPRDITEYHAKYDKEFAQGTLRNDMKKIKSLFSFAVDSGHLDRTPFAGLRFTFKDPDKPFLTYEEIQAIRDAKLDERLDAVRNFFLFLCFSGLEYADVVNLKKEDVKENKYGQLYIKKKRIKTKVEYLSILYEDADELWRLYDGNIPVISNQKSNLYLKEIAKIANITDKNVTLLTARHSYATYLLSRHLIPVDVVQKMLGHTTNRQSLHYAKMLDDTVFDINHRHNINTNPPAETREDLEDVEYFKKMMGI